MTAKKVILRMKVLNMLRRALLCILIVNTGFLYAFESDGAMRYVIHMANTQLQFQNVENTKNISYELPVNDGDIAVFIEANTFKKLVNPYPSNLNALKFIEDNKELLEGSLYVVVYNNSGSYPCFSVQNLVMDVETTSSHSFVSRKNATMNRKIAIGQVFYVMAKDQDGFVTFNNSQRVRGVRKEIHEFSMLKIGLEYINASGNMMHRQLGVSFKDGNTYRHESGYDSELYDLNTHENDMYWDVGNGKKYVIAGLTKFDKRMEIPLVLQIKSEDTIRLFLDQVQGIKQKVYLYDKVTHKKLQLNALGISLNMAKGIYTDRFYVGFHARVFTVTEALERQIQVSYLKKRHALKIECTTSLDFKKVTLLKLLGKEVAHWKGEQLVKNALCLPAIVLKPGVYLVKIETGQGVAVKKIVVKNE